VLYAEEQTARVSIHQTSPLTCIHRSLERASERMDIAASNYLDAISDSLKQSFKPGESFKDLVTTQISKLEPEKLEFLKRKPITFLNAKLEPSISIDVDDILNGHTKPTSPAIPIVAEKIPPPKTVTVTEPSIFKKKPRNTLYGKTSKYDEVDLLKDEEADSIVNETLGFKTALQKLDEDNARNGKPPLPRTSTVDGNDKKRRRNIDAITGLMDADDDEIEQQIPPSKRRVSMAHMSSSIVSKTSKPIPSSSTTKTANRANGNGSKPNSSSKSSSGTDSETELYKGIDPEIAERVLNEILDTNMNVRWTDIAGLQHVKDTLHEMIILPNQHPEMFTGLRAPPRGLLLFGPPGNGKTMIAKAIATEANLTFFSISASVLCSKWIGDGEKTMRALFTIAKAKAPSFIFIDEVDSILCSRSSEEHESSRRLKNEFLTQFDGATSSPSEAVTIMGATNRPFDLDDAARRRMPKRIYVPLPEQATRYNLLSHLLDGENHCLAESEVQVIASQLDGYSCSDIHQLSQQAAMGPVRDKMRSGLMTGALRAINTDDFQKAIETTRPSVAPEECKLYEDFSDKFGTKGL
jgi:SpoVK/Ycf46/Vps4 family AAA+-type ATPase